MLGETPNQMNLHPEDGGKVINIDVSHIITKDDP